MNDLGQHGSWWKSRNASQLPDSDAAHICRFCSFSCSTPLCWEHQGKCWLLARSRQGLQRSSQLGPGHPRPRRGRLSWLSSTVIHTCHSFRPTEATVLDNFLALERIYSRFGKGFVRRTFSARLVVSRMSFLVEFPKKKRQKRARVLRYNAACEAWVERPPVERYCMYSKTRGCHVFLNFLEYCRVFLFFPACG